MTVILQRSVPYDMTPRPLPGIRGLALRDWLTRDEAFAPQMALRARLVTTHRAQVIAAQPGSGALCRQVLQFVLDWLACHDTAYRIDAKAVRRPDGAVVPLDRADPLGTLARLIQEDLCLLTRQGGRHALTAAVLCFPAGWRLADKIGRPLTAIHDPVPSYDDRLAARVQRLFDAVTPDQPLWRFNALPYAAPDLFQPHKVAATRDTPVRYLRSERQSILRLPDSPDDACLFSIHTYVIRTTDSPGQSDAASRSAAQSHSSAPGSGA